MRKKTIEYENRVGKQLTRGRIFLVEVAKGKYDRYIAKVVQRVQ